MLARKMRHSTWERTFADPFTQLLGFDPFRDARRPTRARPGHTPTEGFTPGFDVRETEDAYLLEADLPGVDRESVEIELHQGVLTIRGVREHLETNDEDVYHVSERQHGPFERRFRLRHKVEGDAIKATLNAGVLRVTVAKTPEATPHKIVLTPDE